MIAFAKAQPASAGTLTHPELWERYLQNSSGAMDSLIQAYLPLVNRVLERIAMRLPSHVSIEDLSQTALIGLYKAVCDFDTTRGVPFEGYAFPRIRGAILDELRSSDHLSRGKRARIDQIEQLISTWFLEHGEMPSDEAIARELGMSVPELNLLLDEAKPWCSLDAADLDDTPMHEVVADPGADSDDDIYQHDLQQILREGFRHLDLREQKILYLYYFEDLRLSEIAVLFNLSEARISQIHALSVVRLRAALADRFPSEFVA